ncbi:MAG: divalent metal cation transporter [Acidobacteria bacterium]|nr:divalent metal cation transporter [Acidobacteriota bacterium]
MSNRNSRLTSSIRKHLKGLGPGLVTGASDDDPAGIATYAIAGATLGYNTLWTAVLTLPLMSAVELICARIGLISGSGLIGALRRRYPRPVLYAACGLLLGANVFNIGADLGGMADAAEMLTRVPALVFVVLFAAVAAGVTVFGSYATFARYLKGTALALLAYIAAAFLSDPSWSEVLKATAWPQFTLDRQHVTTLVAILGTTISPYLFFWQASHEVEAEKALGRRTRATRRGATAKELRAARTDVLAGMSLSNVVFYFVILASASTLFRTGHRGIQTTREAAEALRPLAGDAAYLLFGVGLIGSGLLAIPVLAASASFAIAELLGWRSGLDLSYRRARRFYALFTVAIALGIVLDLAGVSPIRALFLSALFNGLAAPPLLVLIMLLSNNGEIMGDARNGFWLNLLGWLATGTMAIAGGAFLATWLG